VPVPVLKPEPTISMAVQLVSLQPSPPRKPALPLLALHRSEAKLVPSRKLVPDVKATSTR